MPAAAFEETVDASLAAGARAIVAIAAGFGETSDEGRERERAVTSVCAQPEPSCSAPTAWASTTSAELDLGSETSPRGRSG